MYNSLFRLTTCLTLLLLSDAHAAGPAQPPGAAQLMDVQVGQTQIPYGAEANRLANPYAGDSSAIVQGRNLFNAMNCVGCHAPEGGGGMGPPLSDQAWIYGKEPGQIYLTILQGRPNGMPSFAKALPPQAIWQLVSYVSTLSQATTEPPGPEDQQTGKP